MAAIFDLRHTQISGRIPTRLFELSDPENMGIAVGISLLSPVQAEIYDIVYVLPVNGGHV